MITVVGTGLKRGQLTLDALAAMESGRVFFHTGRCEAAEYLAEKGIAFSTLDELYDAADDFDEHADLVVSRLLEEAKSGDVVYCVFDVRDETVRALVDGGAHVRVIPGPPMEGALFARSGGSAQVFSAGDVETSPITPFLPSVIREIDSRELAGSVKLRLMEVYPEEWPVLALRGDAAPETVALHRLDRLGEYGHTLSLLVPAVDDVRKLERHDLDSLVRIVRRLCDPDGCPWDREQTHESILPNLIEEAYETADAVSRGDQDLMYDELGDLLYQIAMHAEIGRRHGEFQMSDVTSAIAQKLIRRHPYVYADDVAETEEDTHRIWREVKMQENGQTTSGETLSSVAKALPALMRAEKLAGRARQAGLELSGDVLHSALNRAGELSGTEEGMGDLLFAIAAVAKTRGWDAEQLLRDAGERFTEDFVSTERALTQGGRRMEDFAPEEIFRCFTTKRQERLNHEQD